MAISKAIRWTVYAIESLSSGHMCKVIAIPEHSPQIADMKRILNIVEPIIVPRPISPSPMNTDAIAMNRVGMELPAAMNVAPATSVGMRSLWKTVTYWTCISLIFFTFVRGSYPLTSGLYLKSPTCVFRTINPSSSVGKRNKPELFLQYILVSSQYWYWLSHFAPNFGAQYTSYERETTRKLVSSNWRRRTHTSTFPRTNWRKIKVLRFSGYSLVEDDCKSHSSSRHYTSNCEHLFYHYLPSAEFFKWSTKIVIAQYR